MVVGHNRKGSSSYRRIDANRDLIAIATRDRDAVGDLADRDGSLGATIAARDDLRRVLGEELLTIVLRTSLVNRGSLDRVPQHNYVPHLRIELYVLKARLGLGSLGENEGAGK